MKIELFILLSLMSSNIISKLQRSNKYRFCFAIRRSQDDSPHRIANLAARSVIANGHPLATSSSSFTTSRRRDMARLFA